MGGKSRILPPICLFYFSFLNLSKLFVFDMITQSTKKMIGILGGMGPLASANLYYRLIEIAQRDYHAEQDTDFPPMFLYNITLFGFDETGIVDPKLVKKQLIAGVKKLEQSGSDFIIIACNTVHYFYNDMQQAVRIPIISIIDETTRLVQETRYTIVGLLTSHTTKHVGIYQKALEKLGIRTLLVTEAQQKMLDEVIVHVMSGGQGEEDEKNLKIIVEDLRKQGAEAIILGCTELPLAIHQSDIHVPLFDSTTILAKAALRRALF